MASTSTEIKAFFLSPATAWKLKELWEACQRLGAGQTFQGKEDILSVRFDATTSGKDLNFHLKNWKELSEKVAEERRHGCEEYLTAISGLGESDLRFGSVQNERIYGTVVADFQKRAIVALCFIVRQPLLVTTTTLQDIEDLFASRLTGQDMKDLWASCRELAGSDGFNTARLDSSLVPAIHLGSSPTSARNIHDIYSLRLREVEARCGSENCQGFKPFLATLGQHREIRLGSVLSPRITGLLAVHPEEPQVLAFFFFDRSFSTDYRAAKSTENDLAATH